MLEHVAAFTVRWLHRLSSDGTMADYGVPLVRAVEALDAPVGPIDVFAHGEREAMKRIRQILQAEWGLDRRAMSLSGYWAAGRSEDLFQAEKREPIGQIFES